MKSILMLSVVLTVAHVAVAGTGVFIVTLPELEGVYSEHETWERKAVVKLPSPPSLVYSTTIELSGSAILREHMCDPDYVAFLRPVDFSAMIPDATTGGRWSAEAHVNASGLFQTLSGFVSWNGATWDFVNSGDMEITLRADASPVVDGCWVVGENSEATVALAVFVMVADFEVPTENSSWGRIKALYE